MPIGYYQCSQLLRKTTQKHAFLYSISTIVMAAALVLLIAPKEGMYRQMKAAYDIMTQDTNGSVEDDLQILLHQKDSLHVECAGKNIVILSLESYEYAFLHAINNKVAPNLQRRMRQWNFYNMEASVGCGWTIASLYAVMTGLPNLFSWRNVHNMNTYFFDAKSIKLTTMVDILGACGYEMWHISDNAEVAGTKDLLQTMGLENIVCCKSQGCTGYDREVLMKLFCIAR
jgi:hypothetical protein